jgi:deoxyribose-phosphate aldolase
MSQQLIQTAKLALQLMDLTSLNDNDTPDAIDALCQKARCAHGQVAAICIYPRFIPFARNQLIGYGLGEMKIATVTNFPLGGDDIELAVAQTREAITSGADEVDLVFPWRAFMAGNESIGPQMVAAVKAVCPQGVVLKVILETGELKTPELIAKASEQAIKAGADFIKTSTGKVPVNATPEAAKVMLETIARCNPKCGFKAAGGVKNAQQAEVYLSLARQILGDEWVSAAHFRFGASSLLGALIECIEGRDVNERSGY